ncbi:MAG: hypothetical protein A2X13_09795 [Bacteroidetes bacterium GWC2_33_15]|nr:MAG: hypothetical protein A2X10_10580 [Bacteroidetes bacterium GWA2_33_15]OFX48992.1 MAG: hypothetical protein A2X13_09795 [Bacteroidetes bacterium GWC2_33_15]OFX64744.1 MAG: hypothetical protein A2X15_05420 [Bacteroidetes bacterium GWB2_32_14]OFX68446.1 MAG: hypothetical protein A2X14_14975 [Bacteroidetes bacterium GWD2_33_33]HAN19169.1 hypothetical protein [Bacteroidales bacterium]
MIKRLIYIFILTLIFASCKNDKKADGDFSTEFNVPDSVIYEGDLEISESAMDEIVQNISSPVEMAALIKSLGVPFSKDYLATTDYIDNYDTNFKKALGLGIFGADLGYLNMYNKTGSVIDYISAIKTLADGIRVGQFFDFTTLKRLATNNQNLDSLMYISVQNFNQMDRYLRENNRSNLSSLIVAGVWIEGMYLVGEVARKSPSAELSEKIGEQKIILSNLMILLNNYEKDPKFKELIEDLEEIQKLFKNVIITYEKGEPEAVEEDGMLVIKQNDKQFIEISDEIRNKIINKTADVRNKIIQL